MSGSSANLMVPHAGNRMAPLNAKTILIIDELPARRRRRRRREEKSGNNKGKGSATNNERTSENATRNRLRIAFAKTKWMMVPSRFVLIRHDVVGPFLGSRVNPRLGGSPTLAYSC